MIIRSLIFRSLIKHSCLYLRKEWFCWGI